MHSLYDNSDLEKLLFRELFDIGTVEKFPNWRVR